MKKNTLVLVFVAFVTLFSNAQNNSTQWNVPEDYKLIKAEDYAPYEKDVVACADFLVLKQKKGEAKKQKKAAQFLIAWVSGAPLVMINMNQEVVPECIDIKYMVVFMAGWAKRDIQTTDYKNDLEGNLAGVRAIVKLYKNNKKSLGKDKAVEKYMKLDKKGKLKAFIKAKLESSAAKQ